MDEMSMEERGKNGEDIEVKRVRGEGR